MSCDADFVAIDFGAVSCRMTHLVTKHHMPLILRNTLGNENTTAIFCALEGQQRLAGEPALGKEVSKPASTVHTLKQALCVFDRAPEKGAPRHIAGNAVLADGSGQLSFEFPEGGDEFECDKSFPWTQTAQQVLGFQLKQLLRNAPAPAAPTTQRHVALAVPASTSALYRDGYLRAAAVHVAGVPSERLHLIEEPTAAALYFHHLRFKELPSGAADDDDASAAAAEPTRLVIISVGEVSSFACCVEATQARVSILAQRADACLGTRDIDVSIVDWACAEVLKKSKTDVRDHAKSMNKIRREASKAKVMLSTSERAVLSLESLKDGVDVTLEMTRATLEELAAPVLRRFSEQLFLPIASAFNVARVEVIGQGWRAPCIQNVIKQAFTSCTSLGFALDANTAIAEGTAIAACVQVVAAAAPVAAAAAAAPAQEDGAAAAAAAEPSSPATTADNVSVTHLVKFSIAEGAATSSASAPQGDAKLMPDAAVCGAWAEAEAKMEARDAFFIARLTAHNELERAVLELLEQVDSIDFDAAAPAEQGKDALRAALTKVDDWLRDEGEAASTEQLVAKKAELDTTIASFPAVAAHRAKLAEEQRQKDEELVRLAATREEAKELKSDPQRLRAANERKTQGQKLFVDGDMEGSARRFVEAISILGEIYDTKDEATKKERDAILLSCYLNMASIGIKAKRWRNAQSNASKALEIAPDNAKALFRRGQAERMMSEYAAARASLEKAMSMSGGDAAVKAELDALNADEKNAKAKEKAMYGKMFG